MYILQKSTERKQKHLWFDHNPPLSMRSKLVIASWKLIILSLVQNSDIRFRLFSVRRYPVAQRWIYYLIFFLKLAIIKTVTLTYPKKHDMFLLNFRTSEWILPVVLCLCKLSTADHLSNLEQIYSIFIHFYRLLSQSSVCFWAQIWKHISIWAPALWTAQIHTTSLIESSTNNLYFSYIIFIITSQASVRSSSSGFQIAVDFAHICS